MSRPIASSARTQIGVVNWARSVKGAQVGVLNIAGSSEGVQAGVLNLSRQARGAVLGVVNGALDMDALPVGLVSAGLNMRPGFEVVVDECGYGTASLRLDGRRYHTRFGGIAALSEPQRRFGYAVGFGAHWTPAPEWSLEGDLTQRQLWNDPAENGATPQANWNSASLALGHTLGPATVALGVSFNVLVAYEGDADVFVNPIGPDPYKPSHATRIWPGALLLVRI